MEERGPRISHFSKSLNSCVSGVELDFIVQKLNSEVVEATNIISNLAI